MSETTIALRDIKPNPHQRWLRPGYVQYLAGKMRREGYNVSYPITLSPDNTLIDGGHRIEAARRAGLESVPYLVTTESPVGHSHRCNRDGAETMPPDVFDLSESCASLAAEGWTGERIAAELKWNDPATVTRHTNIKTKLHPRAWAEARSGLTRNGDLVKDGDGDLVNPELTIVNWSESYFRALLKYLPYTAGDNAIMRAQIKAVRAIIERANWPGVEWQLPGVRVVGLACGPTCNGHRTPDMVREQERKGWRAGQF